MRLSQRTRLAVVISHPTQHFVPAYRCLQESPDIELKVIYYSDAGSQKHLDTEFGVEYKWDVDLLEGYEKVFLCPGAPVVYARIDSKLVLTELESFDPDVVLIHGYAQPLQRRACRWARLRGKKILYFSDSTLSGPRRPALLRLAKAAFLRRYFSVIDTFLTVGDRNEEYLSHYGVSRDKMMRCPYPVDVERFMVSLQPDAATSRASTRSQFGIDQEAVAFLFCGKFLPRKRPVDLLSAVLAVRKKGLKAQAVFAGAGELEGEMRDILAKSGDPAAAALLGFVNQSTLPALNHASDVFVMASDEDPHPLVVTEAEACGLPVISSDAVGCVGPTDTVRAGVNALVYPAGNVERLAECVALLTTDSALRDTYSKKSLEIARTQGAPVTAKSIKSAIDRLFKSSAPSGTSSRQKAG